MRAAPAGSGATTRPNATGSGPYDSAKPAAAGVMPTYIAFPQKPTADFPIAGRAVHGRLSELPSGVDVQVDAGRTAGHRRRGQRDDHRPVPPPTPFENNPAWQEINKQLNADVKMNIVAPGDYLAKLATVMAGGDLPDLLFFYYNLRTAITAVAGVPQFLEAQAADLTPYLGR